MYCTQIIRIQVLIVAAGRVTRVRTLHPRVSAVAAWFSAKSQNPALCGPFSPPGMLDLNPRLNRPVRVCWAKSAHQ